MRVTTNTARTTQPYSTLLLSTLLNYTHPVRNTRLYVDPQLPSNGQPVVLEGDFQIYQQALLLDNTRNRLLPKLSKKDLDLRLFYKYNRYAKISEDKINRDFRRNFFTKKQSTVEPEVDTSLVSVN